MRIAILPTGRMECKALPSALSRLFNEEGKEKEPVHVFYALLEGQEEPAHSFTSCDVNRIRGKKNNADKLLELAAAEALGDSRTGKEPADLVVILDDLELDNLNQPQDVIAVLRESAERFLVLQRYNQRTHARYSDVLRNRVSFHIAKPMIEGWLFGDPNGPARAGVPAHKLPPNIIDSDPEDFQTNDPAYLADDGQLCTCWRGLPVEKQKRATPLWLKKKARRERNPKAYLSWLCHEPSEDTCSSYTELGGGASALSQLDWGTLLGKPAHARFVRSMLTDIASALGLCALVEKKFPGDLAPQTEMKTSLSANWILRNL